tara:strand:- start:1386 stop:2237 length:852 start_codon:yes stop_codon:yes gene_type:complete
MQEEQLGIIGFLLLLVLSAVSLVSLIMLDFRRGVARFRPAMVLAEPKWPGATVVVVILTLQAFLIIPGIVMVVLEEAWDTGLDENTNFVIKQTGGMLLGAGFIVFAVLAWVVGNWKLPLSSFGLRWAPFANLLPVVLIYVLFIIPLALLGWFWTQLLKGLGQPVDIQDPVKMFMDAIERGNPLEISLLVFSAVILAPLWEELIFRGLLYGYLKSRMSVFAALLVSSLIFSAYHFNLDALMPLLIVGIATGYIYERTRSLYFAIFFHALFNALSMAVLFILAGS